MGETQPYLGGLFTTALNIGTQFATKKLGLADTTQTQALNQFQNQLSSNVATVQPVATSEGGFSFGLDNTTLLMLAAVVVLVIVLK